MGKLNVPNFLKTMKTNVVKHSPEILTGVGIAGMGTAIFLAVKDTPKAIRLIEDEKASKGEPLTKKEVVKVAWKCYIPAAATWMVSATCLIGASSVNLKRNAALATAYQISRTAISEYRDKVVETIGEEKEKIIREKIAAESTEKNRENKTVIIGGGEFLFQEPITKQYFRSTINEIDKIVNNINKRMLLDMYVSVNELHSEFGVEHTDMGNELGWNVDKGYIEVSYGHGISDRGEPYIMLKYEPAPQYNYSKLA